MTLGQVCWPKFKVRLLERAKLDSLGRAKLDTRPAVNVDADHLTFQALSIGRPIAISNSLSLDCSGNAPTSGPTARPNRRSGNRNRRHAEVNKTWQAIPLGKMRLNKRNHRGTGRSLLSSRATVGSSRLRKTPFQNRYLPRIRGTTGFVGSGLASRT